ncbi:MAG: pectate lyase [uncultured bacterium]|nr:MAG: pectate lyase [uncultured bacterium]
MKGKIKHIFLKIFINYFLLFFINTLASALPAFPGAEGQGASTVGGRGGTIYKVTTLADSGVGSLRAAVEASGPRIVVFAVSGYINLLSELVIRNPYITIAGQTSPGGICITGWTTRIYQTHDVIITHIRFRPGSHGQGVTLPEEVHAMVLQGTSGVANPVYNVIVDHCSLSFGIDETIDVAYNVYDATFSWCIIGPGLLWGHSEGSHSAGLVFWGKYASPNQIVTAHHNYFPNNHFRDPEIGTGVTADLRNNVSYNFTNALSSQFNHATGASHSYMNFVHNYAKPGPDSNVAPYGSEMFFADNDDPTGKCHAQDINAYPAIYYRGNIGYLRTLQTDPEWQIITGWSPFSLLSTLWQATTPFAVRDIPVTTNTMSLDYAKEILGHTGATKPVRDSYDTGLVQDFMNGTELFQPINVTYPAQYPVLSAPQALVDTDNDGMSDTWETSKFGDTTRNGKSDFDSDGYSDVEEYLFELGGYVVISQLSAPQLIIVSNES